MREAASSTRAAAPDAPTPLVSVVMPAYGVAAHIDHAIACVRDQTFADWELVVVDDASPDASADVARAHASADPRVRVVSHERNRGLSAARNTGIAVARGRWVWLPDPDDSYDVDLLSAAIRAVAAAPSEPDAVLFGYVERFYGPDGAFLRSNERPLEAATFSHGDEWHRLVAGLERSTHYGYAWNKLYRLDRVRALDLAFEDVRLIEDVAFNVAYFDEAEGLVVLDGAPYAYEKREGVGLTNANAYGASEYWELHERRVRILRDQLARWGVLDEGASVLGSLYVRFVVSTLARSHEAPERWEARRRRRWLAGLRETSLFQELVPVAEAESSRTLAAAIRALKGGRDGIVAAIALSAHLARRHAYGAFARVRSGR